MAGENNHRNDTLGSALRALRLKRKESLLEVSSAIEISGERLARIENGELSPSEDILHLLLSHYVVSEHEEDKLWDLAGFGKKLPQEGREDGMQQNFFVLPFDSRVMYADSMQVVINDHGVVMSFMQPTGNGQQIAVAKVGMSMTHAKNVVQVLQKTIEQSEQGPAPQKSLRAQNDAQ